MYFETKSDNQQNSISQISQQQFNNLVYSWCRSALKCRSLYSKCKICKPHCVELIGIVVMYCNMRPHVAVVDTDWACWIGASLAETSSVHLSSSHISFAKFF